MASKMLCVQETFKLLDELKAHRDPYLDKSNQLLLAQVAATVKLTDAICELKAAVNGLK